MEAEEKETIKQESDELTVDFSKQTLKKIERANNDQKAATVLILDDNEIQRLDNLDSYPSLKKLSLVKNQLIRMYGVSHLIHLETLDLSYNSLVTIEGLKDLKELKHLDLKNNKIKNIEHLNSNVGLVKVDLSDNYITHIADISYLTNLKELNLHGNKISHLRQCEKNLPEDLEVLTLNNNLICDLNEVSHLVQLTSLKKLSFSDNPCVDFTENTNGFNYRPFVKNWCSSLTVLDNRPLDDIECLKAEWLYSQGRGRSFRTGEHAALAEYLSGVCPLKVEPNSETDDVRKLKLILSKAQQHQQQLREQLSTGNFVSHELNKLSLNKKKSICVPERMVTSFQDSPSKDLRYSPELMTRSLDSGMLRNSSPPQVSRSDLKQTPLQTSSTFIPIPDTLISPDVCQPFVPSYPSLSISSRTSYSSTKNSPHSTPESKRKTPTNILRRQNDGSNTLKKQGRLVNSRSSTPLGKNLGGKKTSSPGGKGDNAKEPDRNNRETSEEEDSEILAMKLLAIQQRASQRRQNKKLHSEIKRENTEETDTLEGKKEGNFEKKMIENETWKAAVCIQRRWRGYRARNLDGEVLTACKTLQITRMQDYITKVVNDMEATRLALEGNRKLQVLQMQAINALWKKITALHPNEGVENSNESKVSLQTLVETCSSLNKQVENLQATMKDMQNSSKTSLNPIGTQTEIIAVHTPQDENKQSFPYTLNLKTDHLKDDVHFSNTSLTKCDEQSCLHQEIENDYSSEGTECIQALDSKSKISKEKCLSSTFPKEKDSKIFSEKLTKPTVRLNETPSEISFLSVKENVEVQIKEDSETPTEKKDLQNGCSS